MLMPPTLKTIEELSGFSSIDQVFEAAANKTILPILPQSYITESGFAIKLPHDPEYTIDAYKQPFRKDDPSRVVMIDGRFRTMFLIEKQGGFRQNDKFYGYLPWLKRHIGGLIIFIKMQA